jgi:hypothetical protein
MCESAVAKSLSERRELDKVKKRQKRKEEEDGRGGVPRNGEVIGIGRLSMYSMYERVIKEGKRKEMISVKEGGVRERGGRERERVAVWAVWESG